VPGLSFRTHASGIRPWQWARGDLNSSLSLGWPTMLGNASEFTTADLGMGGV